MPRKLSEEFISSKNSMISKKLREQRHHCCDFCASLCVSVHRQALLRHTMADPAWVASKKAKKAEPTWEYKDGANWKEFAKADMDMLEDHYKKGDDNPTFLLASS